MSHICGVNRLLIECVSLKIARTQVNPMKGA